MQTLLKKTAKYLAILVMVIGILVLVGWGYDIEFLKRPMANLVAMNPITAVGFILSGLALIMLRNTEKKAFHTGSIITATAVILIGAVRILEETTSIDLDIDERLFPHKLITDAVDNISNRMGATLAFNFVLLGVAILLSGYESRKRLANNIVFFLLTMVLFSFLGYIYYVTEFHRVLAYLPISIHAVFCFALMGAAILCVNSQGFMRVFTSTHAGGRIARRLVPAIIFIPILFGFIRLWLFWKQPFSVELGVAGLITCIVVVFFALTWYLSTVLDKSDAARTVAKEQLEQFNKDLELIVAERTEKLVIVNRRYAFTSAINQSIVHISNQQELLNTACNIALEIGQFKMAWIGLLDENNKLNRVSFSGDKIAAKKILRESLDINDAAFQDIPAVKVIRTGQYIINNDVQNDPALSAWKDELVIQEIRASIAMPIVKFGKVAGIFGMHCTIKNFFDEKEIALLKEASGDISFALEVMQKEKLRKEAEEEIKRLNDTLEERVQERTAELTEANKELEAFSSTVSHDLNAPVRAVISFAKIIRQEYGDKMELKEKELFGYIEDSGKRMSAIIEDLLKLAKHGNERFKLERVNMSRLVRGIWQNISRTTPHKAELELQEDLIDVEVDMSMMEQVIVNLLSNAIKYSSKKVKPIVSVRCEKTNQNVTFYFTDNGAGFDMKNYDRLFGAFQRFHSPRDFEGTGVGLTLVKRIIEKHGGTVGAEAKVGEGATFYFTLPMSN